MQLHSLQDNNESNLGEKFGTNVGVASLPIPVPLDLNINGFEPVKGDNNLLPDIPSFQEYMFGDEDQFNIKGNTNKLICRLESHDRYSPSFSTICDIENIDNLDLGSDGLCTSKTDNQTYNVIFQSQLPQFVPLEEPKPSLAPFPNFSSEVINKHNVYLLDQPIQVHPQPSTRLQSYCLQPVYQQQNSNSQSYFTEEELKSAAPMEIDLYYSQMGVVGTQYINDINMNNAILNNIVQVNGNYADAMGSNIQSLSNRSLYTISSNQNVIAAEFFKDYSRAKEISSEIENKFVQEGFEMIQIPKYKPIEFAEKTVQVPVVHKIDTIVNVDKIQHVEKIVKVPYEKYIDKIVEETEIHYQDKIIEVPEYYNVTKTVKVPEVRERVKYKPIFDVRTVPKYVEVPNVQIVDKYEEYEEMEEVCTYVPQTQVIEVPKETVKTVATPIKKIIAQEIIKPVIKTRKIPVEKIKYVDKYETVEVIRNIPQVIDVPIPQHIPKVEYIDQPYEVEKYRDIQVPYHVKKIIKPIYYYTDEIKYVEVPVYKPYLVIHDHIDFKLASNVGEECQFHSNSGNASNNNQNCNSECKGYSK